jgi:hypothetical protein
MHTLSQEHFATADLAIALGCLASTEEQRVIENTVSYEPKREKATSEACAWAQAWPDWDFDSVLKFTYTYELGVEGGDVMLVGVTRHFENLTKLVHHVEHPHLRG